MHRFLVLLSALALTGCVSAPPCRTSTQLFLGAAIGTSGRVDDKAFAQFVEDAVLPRFPDGFSVFDGRGYWRAPGATQGISEPTRTLVVLHGDTAESRGKLDAIAADYKRRFAQDSVLRLDQCGAISFQ